MGVKGDGSLDRRHVKAKDQKTATRRVRELERQRDAGTAAKPGRVPTVATWMELYLDTVAVNKVAPRTLEGYWSLARNWIIPHLGRHRLDRLRPEHLDALYAAMRSAGLAPSHVLKVHRVVSRALKIAVCREMVGRNVAQLVDPPSVEAREKLPLTRTEARRVPAVAEQGRNRVRWSVGLASLPAALLPKLVAHREAQEAERDAAGSAWHDHDLVFCQPDGTPIDPRQDWQEWKSLLKAAGVRDARVHDGRHTAATLLIEQGVHVRVAQEILGHSDIRVTEGYTHVASSVARDAAERMGAALWGD